jgi:hypothetical protein
MHIRVELEHQSVVSKISYSTFYVIYSLQIHYATVLLTHEQNKFMWQQQMKLDSVTKVIYCNPGAQAYNWQCESHAAAISSDVQCQQFIDNFKQYLVICLPVIKHYWELKKVISNTYSNM